MQILETHERRWLETMRLAWSSVFVGIDHHSDQITVAAASGQQFQSNQSQPDGKWIPTRAFEQDSLGYLALLDWLAERFPDSARGSFVFLAEPTFAKPLSRFLVTQGFCRERVLWVRPFEVPPFRKAKGIGKAGKNDVDDARALVTMAFDAAAAPHEHRALFVPAPFDLRAEGLKLLARDYERRTRQVVAIKNQIVDLVQRLFPECRRIWHSAEKVRDRDGNSCEQRHLSLFRGDLPMRVLARFPTPESIADAGFDALWKEFGKRGVYKRHVQQLVDLAERSAGVNNPFDARRLTLLIQDYLQQQEQLDACRKAMIDFQDGDPILKSFEQIAFLGPQAIAAIVGSLGDVSRFRDFDAVKRYLNVAPVPLPQSGDLDANGRPIQAWRLPSNSYRRHHGRKLLVYENRGIKTVRLVGYRWFDVLVLRARHVSNDPFVQLYLRLKSDHQGEPRWLGKVRWKVVAKLLGAIYHCLAKQVTYDPSRVLKRIPAET